MAKYIMCFVWGAGTMTAWFLTFVKFKDYDPPNLFLLPAILSTLVATLVATLLTLKENGKLR